MYTLNTYDSRTHLDEQFADDVATLLNQAISENGRASIAVSGGSTPKGFFNALSQKSLDWSKVTITLADERWVESSSDASNTTLVKDNLLTNEAASASFFELKRDGEISDETLSKINDDARKILPLDVLVLGMGGDGHTASLFPCCDQIELALSETAPAVLRTVPKTAPHERITFSLPALKASKHIFLHVVGDDKKQVLDEALSSNDIKQMPIRAFICDDTTNVSINWAE